MTNPENQLQDQLSAHEWLEALSEEELQAISGGVSISMLPQVLRRSFSESDLTRLARLHPAGIDHGSASPASSTSSSLSGDEIVHAGWSPQSVLDRAKGHL